MNQPSLPALGASGAISGVIMLFSLMYPNEKLLLLGFIPMPAMVGAVLFVGLDLWGLIAQTQGSDLPIGHGAHLGGALYALVYYYLVMRKKKNTNQLVF
jgi:membrane associated rhomboid family serine protease